MTTSSGFRGWRRAAFAVQAAAVLGLPFVRVGGESALRFDAPSLTVHAFGVALQIDELFVVLAAILAASSAFVLATVVLGRVWCGWACPQTVLCEATEVRAAARWPLMAVVSAVASANVLWYFVTPQEFARRLATASMGPVLGGSWAVLAAMLFAHLALVRYRFCATVCPYAKLQGALFDRGTLVVAYDARRAGECVECKACVRACPVGIDIRDGLQSACIACAQCADACGPIMARLGRSNLVGYAFGEPGAPRRLARPAVLALGVLTVAAFGLLATAAARRQALDLGVTAIAGFAARMTPDGRALNGFEVSLTNRGAAPLDVTLSMTVGGAASSLLPSEVRLAAGEHRQVRVLAAASLQAGGAPVAAELVAEVAGNDRLRMTRALLFVPPDPGGSR